MGLKVDLSSLVFINLTQKPAEKTSTVGRRRNTLHFMKTERRVGAGVSGEC